MEDVEDEEGLHIHPPEHPRVRGIIELLKDPWSDKCKRSVEDIIREAEEAEEEAKGVREATNLLIPQHSTKE